MFCVACKTKFNWETLEIMKGASSNPHYLEEIRARTLVDTFTDQDTETDDRGGMVIYNANLECMNHDNEFDFYSKHRHASEKNEIIMDIVEYLRKMETCKFGVQFDEIRMQKMCKTKVMPSIVKYYKKRQFINEIQEITFCYLCNPTYRLICELVFDRRDIDYFFSDEEFEKIVSVFLDSKRLHFNLAHRLFEEYDMKLSKFAFEVGFDKLETKLISFCLEKDLLVSQFECFSLHNCQSHKLVNCPFKKHGALINTSATADKCASGGKKEQIFNNQDTSLKPFYFYKKLTKDSLFV
jgi:hypothetical protein